MLTNLPLNGKITITAAFGEVNKELWPTAPHTHKTGVHLHYEILDVYVNPKGVSIDPSRWTGIPNKHGSYTANEYPARQWKTINGGTSAPAEDYKAKYEAEVKAHEATKSSLVQATAKLEAVNKSLSDANSKINAVKAALG